MKKPELKIVPLVDHNHNSMSWSAEDVLKSALKEIENGEIKKNAKLMVLYLDEENGFFTPYYLQCGMRASDMLQLLEVAKLKIFTRHMM